MAVVSLPNAPAAFELRSAALTLVAWLPRSADLGVLADALARQAADAPGLFDGEPVAIDFSHVRDDPADVDVAALVALLRRHHLLPIAAKSGSQAQMAAALAAGLVEVPEGQPARAAAAPTAAPATPPAPPQARTTLIVDRPLRSGQQVYARGGDLVVTALVSYGAEIVADGNIHVYAPLRGRALAGALGDTGARIFATCMEPQLLSIAGTWRTTEIELAPAVLGKPAQVRLDGTRLVVEALGS